MTREKVESIFMKYYACNGDVILDVDEVTEKVWRVLSKSKAGIYCLTTLRESNNSIGLENVNFELMC